MSLKAYVNTIKIYKNSKPVKSCQKSYLMVEMLCFCDLRTLSANFLHFLGTSKIATLAQNFDYKKALLGPKGGTTAHRKFRGFQKWGQILP